jgi:hypothetical protein
MKQVNILDISSFVSVYPSDDYCAYSNAIWSYSQLATTPLARKINDQMSVDSTYVIITEEEIYDLAQNILKYETGSNQSQIYNYLFMFLSYSFVSELQNKSPVATKTDAPSKELIEYRFLNHNVLLVLSFDSNSKTYMVATKNFGKIVESWIYNESDYEVAKKRFDLVYQQDYY